MNNYLNLMHLDNRSVPMLSSRKVKNQCTKILSNPCEFGISAKATNAYLDKALIAFPSKSDCRLVLNPEIISTFEMSECNKNSDLIWFATEKILDGLYNGNNLLLEHFYRHLKFVRYLRPHRDGTWQGITRYDFLRSVSGEFKLLELNTSCPAGLFFQKEINDALKASILNHILALGDYNFVENKSIPGLIFDF